MVYGMIDPQISGAYNAWRMILCNVCAAGASYAVGALVETADPLVLLIPSVAAYLVSMVWYCVLYGPMCARAAGGSRRRGGTGGRKPTARRNTLIRCFLAASSLRRVAQIFYIRRSK